MLTTDAPNPTATEPFTTQATRSDFIDQTSNGEGDARVPTLKLAGQVRMVRAFDLAHLYGDEQVVPNLEDMVSG